MKIFASLQKRVYLRPARDEIGFPEEFSYHSRRSFAGGG